MVEVQQQQQAVRAVLQQAQTALEESRTQETIAACHHVLRHFPHTLTALRLLGESYLEVGRPDEAAQAFGRVLASDPHNVLAQIGLGVIAEDSGEDERAIAQFRLAWEIQPTLPQLRSELVRLYRKRYGVGGRLRLTRVALANLYAHNEELPRAIRQFALMREEHPERIDLAIGLIDALWRHGDDDEAAAAAEKLLAERPLLARLPLILAAIRGDRHARQGEDQPGLLDLLQQARVFDPDGALARELLSWRESPTLTAFVEETVEVAPFDVTTAAAEVASALGQGKEDTALRWDDIASDFTSLAGTTQAATPGPVHAGSAEDDVASLFADIDRQLATTNVDEPGDAALLEFTQESAPPANSGESFASAPDTMMPETDEPDAVTRLTDNWDNIDDELAAARPADDVVLGTDFLSELGDVSAFDVEDASAPDAEPTVSFDPSKFSLPPLDDEEDDALADLDVEGLDLDVSPFKLEETAATPGTGLTFSDLVSGTPASSQGSSSPEPQDQVITSGELPFGTGELDIVPLSPEEQAQAAVDNLLSIDLLGSDAGATVELTPDDLTTEFAGDAAPEAVASDEPASEETLTASAFADDFAAENSLPSFDEARVFENAAADEDLPAASASDTPDSLFDRLRQSKPDENFTSDLLATSPTAEEDVDAVDEASAQSERDRLVAESASDRDEQPVSGPTLVPTGHQDEFALNTNWLASLIDNPLTTSELDTQPRSTSELMLLRGVGFNEVATGTTPPLSTDDDLPAEAADEMAHEPLAPPTDLHAAAEAEAVIDSPAEPVDEDQDSLIETDVVAPEADDSQQMADQFLQSAPRTETPETLQQVASVAKPVEDAPAKPAARTPRARQRQTDQLIALKALVASDPQNPFARLTLAVAYSATQPDLALNEYRLLIKEASPDDEIIEEVIERLKEMIADNQSIARAHRVLGDAFMKRDEYDLAMAEFQRALLTRSRAAK